MTLRIKLFGSFELERGGRPLPRFASRKSGELFAYLALNRQAPHTREHLAGVFWGDSSEERARHTLNTTLWRINRVLEPPDDIAYVGRYRPPIESPARATLQPELLVSRNLGLPAMSPLLSVHTARAPRR